MPKNNTYEDIAGHYQCMEGQALVQSSNKEFKDQLLVSNVST